MTIDTRLCASTLIGFAHKRRRKSMKRFALFVLVMSFVPFSLAAKVTSVTAAVTPASFKGPCPKLFEFTGVITVDSPGVVTYKWIRSDGAQAPGQKVEFRQAGRQTVKSTWTLGDATKLPRFNGWQEVQVLSPETLVSNKAEFNLTCPQLAIRPPVTAPRPGTVPTPNVTTTCIDPAAAEIRFEIVRRETQFRGRVRITGVVKNIGNTAFSCNGGAMQASAHLYELPTAATSGGTLRAHTDFSSLAVNDTVTVSYERDWDSSSPSEGEFSPSYKLIIVYDPDILLDSNTANDDCNNRNNNKSRSGSEINAMLR
ncbi:MAG: hypothetical protein ABI837_14065 [Acidobacteriota bacterium]